jgi:hypothetical protein
MESKGVTAVMISTKNFGMRLQAAPAFAFCTVIPHGGRALRGVLSKRGSAP